MGAREDLVRQRIEKEGRDAVEQKHTQELREAESETLRRAQYVQLIDELDKEAARIADILKYADWTKAELITFTTRTGGRWWWRNQKTEYACLRICKTLVDTCSYPLLFWMRSDDVMMIQDIPSIDGSYRLNPPNVVFPYDREEHNCYRSLNALQDCLKSLQRFESLTSLPWDDDSSDYCSD